MMTETSGERRQDPERPPVCVERGYHRRVQWGIGCLDCGMTLVDTNPPTVSSGRTARGGERP